MLYRSIAVWHQIGLMHMMQNRLNPPLAIMKMHPVTLYRPAASAARMPTHSPADLVFAFQPTRIHSIFSFDWQRNALNIRRSTIWPCSVLAKQRQLAPYRLLPVWAKNDPSTDKNGRADHHAAWLNAVDCPPGGDAYYVRWWVCRWVRHCIRVDIIRYQQGPDMLSDCHWASLHGQCLSIYIADIWTKT